MSALLAEQLDERRTARPDEGEVLSAFFVAAGMHQILEDRLHGLPRTVGRAEARLRTFDHPLAQAARRLLAAAVSVGTRARAGIPRERECFRWTQEFARLVQALAAAVVSESPAHAIDAARAAWRRLEPAVETFPEVLLGTVMRLPNPFANFDQAPADCRALTRRFAAAWPDRDRPILIVGIRTSGNYLAPLYHALLRAEGYLDVEMITVRPGDRWHSVEIRLLHDVSERGGLAVIVDDPPVLGRVGRRVAEACLSHGADRDSIVFLLQLFGPRDSLDEVLRGYHSVVLAWREWAIHDRLDPARVRDVLAGLLVGHEIRPRTVGAIRVAGVTKVERLDREGESDRASRRGHVRAVYRAHLVGEAGGEEVQDVKVQGVGLGYFSDHARAVSTTLAEYVPEVYGIRDGLAYSAWLPDEWRLAAGDSGAEARVAEYIHGRRERLPVAGDVAARIVDQYAAWDLIADMLGMALLGALRIAVFPLTHAAGRRLIEVARPNVVDGSMEASNWFAPPGSCAADTALKVDYDRRSFANAARVSYDAIFDLASAGASFDVDELLAAGDGDVLGPSFSERLLEAYTAVSADDVDRERWLLYQLLHNRARLVRLFDTLASLERRRRDGPAVADAGQHPAHLVGRLLAAERALATAHQRYFGDLYLHDLDPGASGPLCALDVDWVLETRWLDFPAITPAGALALRALIRHGFRPVIATGRSLGEVRRRCRAYRLAGGVAEYGTVVYDHLSGRVLSQVEPADEAELARLRAVLGRMPGVYVDGAYRYGVRALRLSEDGKRRRLTDEMAAEAVAAAAVADSVQVMYGHLQTDFVPVSANKGTGLRALATALGVDGDAERPFAFAIGDDAPDIPMLELASARFAPANATRALRDDLVAVPGLTIVEKRHGAGLLSAVTAFLGHAPRRCRTCAPPQLSARTKLVTIPLAAAEGSRRARLARAAALAAVLLGSGGGGGWT